MLLKRATALVAGATLPLAAAIALAPAAAAQNSPTVTQTVEVTYTCTPNNALNIGGVNTWTNEVQVTYPTFVSPGEFFDVSIRPGPMPVNTNRLARLTYDIQAPANADYRTQELTSTATGITSGTPALLAVDPTSRTSQPGSDVIRVWGGASARYGATPTGNNLTAGLQVNNSARTPIQLPEVTFSMRAPNTPSETMVFGLAGAGATSATNAATTQFQYTRGTTQTGTTSAQIECAVSANAAALTSTTITNAPWVPFEWNTNLNVQGQVGPLDEDSQEVNVVTSFQRPANNFPEGAMVRVLRDGVEVGQVEIPETGTSVTYVDDVDRAPTTQVVRYTAEIVGTSDALGDTWTGASATSAPVIVTGLGGDPGGTGSLDLGSLDAGSLTDLAQGSLSDSVGYDVAPVSVVLPDLSATLSSGS